MHGILHAFKRSTKKPSEASADSDHASSGNPLVKSLSLPAGDENLDPGSPLRPTKLLAGLPSTPQSYHGRAGPSADFFAPARSSMTLSRMSDSDSDVSVPAARPATSHASSFTGPVRNSVIFCMCAACVMSLLQRSIAMTTSPCLPATHFRISSVSLLLCKADVCRLSVMHACWSVLQHIQRCDVAKQPQL